MSGWDTAQVKDMGEMFKQASEFNGDVSKWDTTKVEYMSGVFWDAAKFNQNLSKWSTAAVMFEFCDFARDSGCLLPVCGVAAD